MIPPTRKYAVYGDANQILSETLNGVTVTNIYDALLRRITNGVVASGTWLTLTTNGYDAASRLLVVSDRTNSAKYTYLTNSPLVSQILFQQSGTTRMTTTKTYDNLNRLLAISNTPSADSVISFNYAYNSANQRTSRTDSDSSYWIYQYDSLGQVISAKHYWSDGTAVAGQQFEYGFDDIGFIRKVGA
jgi:YD repeat-containing protein